MVVLLTVNILEVDIPNNADCVIYIPPFAVCSVTTTIADYQHPYNVTKHSNKLWKLDQNNSYTAAACNVYCTLKHNKGTNLC